MKCARGKATGFTLVELLVVIGIIAVLVGILLPVLGRVRSTANTVACSAQLRGHIQGLIMYAAENRGSYPYGVSWQQTAPNSSFPASIDDGFSGTAGYYHRAFHWWTSLQSMTNRDGRAGLWPQQSLPTTVLLSDAQVKLNASFVCPETRADEVSSGVPNTYAGHSVIMPNPSYETSDGTASVTTMRASFNGLLYTPPTQFVTSRPIAPAKQGQLYPDNAVLWDTVIWRNNTPTFQAMNLWGGFAWSMVDYGRLAQPKAMDWRYRGVMQNPPAIDNPKDSNFLPAMAYEKQNYSSYKFHFVNADVYSDTQYVYFFQYGTPMFRHNRGTACNVAFADGSVRTVHADFNKVDPNVKGPYGEPKAVNEFTREWLQIKPPAGLSLEYPGKGIH
jgi:prepilin-type processing-associated H-X9-DG protein/prepilin-type N-terminal cleavage/methylation domain-containing protein